MKKKCFLQESIFGNCKLTTHGLNNSHFEVMNEITNGLNMPNLERIKPNQVSNWIAYLTKNTLFFKYELENVQS